MLKNKKGFTLIELLAVIVILAIILVIAVPSVMSSINTSRNRAFIESYENLLSEVQDRIIQKKINKDIKIECSDTRDLSEKYNYIDDYCSTLYQISDEDYSMNVLLYENVYFVILEGTGKFESVDYSKNASELLKKYYYPFNHNLNTYDVSKSESLEDNPNYYKNSLMTVISKNGKIINLENVIQQKE